MNQHPDVFSQVTSRASSQLAAFDTARPPTPLLATSTSETRQTRSGLTSRACSLANFMATVSLSPTPAPIAAMSSRRIPLTNNPNAANSPLRGSSTLAAFAKQKRSYATTQREEAYGQPPPMKKQALENGSHRLVRSPSKLPRSQLAVRSNATQPQARDRVVRPTATSRSVQDADAEKEVWKKHHMARFPKMVFYFESIPDDVRAKLIKRVTYLGAVCFYFLLLLSLLYDYILTCLSSFLASRTLLLH